MITVLKGERSGLEKISDLGPDIWVNLVNPSATEITRLQGQTQIPHDFLVSALDTDEKARTDKDDDAQLILLRVPLHEPSEDVPFLTIPLGIIMTSDSIVTVCQKENEVIQDFLSGQVPGWSTAKRNRFLLQLLLRTANRYLRYLRQIDKEVGLLEDRLQHSLKNQELQELLKYQKSLVYFATALKSNELMMERLQRSRIFEKYPDDQDLLEDVLTENQQAIEMVGISSNILSQMMDAFASIISNNLNVVMKFLTLATIILALPTLVASVYGMNVGLPLEHSPYAFLIIIGISLVLCISAVFLFKRKNWF